MHNCDRTCRATVRQLRIAVRIGLLGVPHRQPEERGLRTTEIAELMTRAARRRDGSPRFTTRPIRQKLAGTPPNSRRRSRAAQGTFDLKARSHPSLFYLPSPSALCLRLSHRPNSSKSSLAMLASAPRARMTCRMVSIGVAPLTRSAARTRTPLAYGIVALWFDSKSPQVDMQKPRLTFTPNGVKIVVAGCGCRLNQQK